MCLSSPAVSEYFLYSMWGLSSSFISVPADYWRLQYKCFLWRYFFSWGILSLSLPNSWLSILPVYLHGLLYIRKCSTLHFSCFLSVVSSWTINPQRVRIRVSASEITVAEWVSEWVSDREWKNEAWRCSIQTHWCVALPRTHVTCSG